MSGFRGVALPLLLVGWSLAGCCNLEKCSLEGVSHSEKCPLEEVGHPQGTAAVVPPGGGGEESCSSSTGRAVAPGTPPAPLGPGACHVVTLDADQPTQPLGVLLEGGKRYHWRVTTTEPLWDCTIAANPGTGNGPARGWLQQGIMDLMAPFKECPGENYFVLMGRFGEGGECFKVGCGGSLEVATRYRDGVEPRLFLNDVPGYYCNNRGKLRIRVTRPPDDG